VTKYASPAVSDETHTLIKQLSLDIGASCGERVEIRELYSVAVRLLSDRLHGRNRATPDSVTLCIHWRDAREEANR
jgi:hypothetical protein